MKLLMNFSPGDLGRTGIEEETISVRPKSPGKSSWVGGIVVRFLARSWRCGTSSAIRNGERLSAFLPLPKGEGRGEGKRRAFTTTPARREVDLVGDLSPLSLLATCRQRAARQVAPRKGGDKSPHSKAVAQIFNLLYRRFAIGRASAWNSALKNFTAPQVENLRYSRLQICATTLVLLCAILTLPAAEWVNVSDSVTAQVKPGYAGPTAGVVVDRANGDVFMVVSDQGLWKSSDHGKTFARVDDKAIGGRCETGWALQADPNGSRMFCFMIYGGSAMTTDGGKTWAKSKVSHLDFGSVDWADTGKRLIAIRHESGGMLTTSDDGGATWKDLEKGFSCVGVFDSKTFVVTKEKTKGIFRSTDTGATWTEVSPNTPSAGALVVFKGTGYWPTGKGVLVSKDKGATWSELGAPVDAMFGPFFGKDENHFVVVGKSGFQETKDGGKTWTLAAPLPAGFTANRVGPNYAWDPNVNIFYASTMTKPTFKLERK